MIDMLKLFFANFDNKSPGKAWSGRFIALCQGEQLRTNGCVCFFSGPIIAEEWPELCNVEGLRGKPHVWRPLRVVPICT